MESKEEKRDDVDDDDDDDETENVKYDDEDDDTARLEQGDTADVLDSCNAEVAVNATWLPIEFIFVKPINEASGNGVLWLQDRLDRASIFMITVFNPIAAPELSNACESICSLKDDNSMFPAVGIALPFCFPKL